MSSNLTGRTISEEKTAGSSPARSTTLLRQGFGGQALRGAARTKLGQKEECRPKSSGTSVEEDEGGLMYYVYVLSLCNGDYYVGVTADLRRRLSEHHTGGSPTTSRFLPVRLVSFVAFEDRARAERFERYLKSGSGVAFRNRHLI